MSEQWKVSWESWPHASPASYRSERVHDSEKAARTHIHGLKSLQAPHELRPCDDHVWNIALERRQVVESQWEAQP